MYTVNVPENYQSNGEEKTKWHRVGTLFVDPETKKMSLKIENIPIQLMKAEGWCNVFVNKPRENAVEGAKRAEADGIEAEGEEVDLSAIPF